MPMDIRKCHALLKEMLQLNGAASSEEVVEATLLHITSLLQEDNRNDNAFTNALDVNAFTNALDVLASAAETAATLKEKWWCENCGQVETPQKRSKGTLCNACGLQGTYDADKRRERNTTAYKEVQQSKASSRKARFVSASRVLKSAKKAQRNKHRPPECKSCGATDTKHWRAKGNLCNSCGLGAKRHLNRGRK